MRIVAHWVQRALDTLELELQVWVLVPKLGLSARMSSLPVSVLSRLSGACVKVVCFFSRCRSHSAQSPSAGIIGISHYVQPSMWFY